MTERRIRHVPVVVDGKLAGLVSIGDVVKNHIATLEHESKAMHDYIAKGRLQIEELEMRIARACGMRTPPPL